MESAKLRALRALAPYLPRAPRASSPTCSRVHRALVPYVPLAPRTLCRTCSCVSRASSSMWPHALRFMCPFSLRTLLFRTLRTVCPNITFFALEFPCITLLFFCSFATCDFFWKFTKVKRIYSLTVIL